MIVTYTQPHEGIVAVDPGQLLRRLHINFHESIRLAYWQFLTTAAILCTLLCRKLSAKASDP